MLLSIVLLSFGGEARDWMASLGSFTADVYWRGLACFVLSAIVDASWAIYMRRSTSGHAAQAAFAAMILLGIGMFNTKTWLGNGIYIPAILAGAWVGTYVMIRIDHARSLAKGAAEVTGSGPPAPPSPMIS